MTKFLILAVGVLSLLWATPAATMASSGTRLQASLSSLKVSMKGSARYEEIPRDRGVIQQRFKVEIQNAKPGAKFAITAGGAPVGSIVANAFGRAEVELRTNGDDPAKATSSLPRLKSGSVVTVGPISGVLR